MGLVGVIEEGVTRFIHADADRSALGLDGDDPHDLVTPLIE